MTVVEARRMVPQGTKKFTPPEDPLQDPGSRKKPSNRKLGHLIWTFSLPTKATCPGKTAACAKSCYAFGFLFRMMWARLIYLWEWSKKECFVNDVLKQIRMDSIQVCRPHVAGDFYSVGYAAKWLEIFSRAKAANFYFYTRSWRRKDGSVNRAMVRIFKLMAKLPNVHVWFSEDRDSGKSPRVDGVRVAFTVFSDEDEELVPAHASLVFRNTVGGKKHLKPAKWVKDVWVCPVEQGIARDAQISCSTCKYCFTDRRMP